MEMAGSADDRDEQLADALERAARAERLLPAFAAKVSHDLKNPLASVAMSLEMLQDVVGEDPDGRDFVERAGRGVERMTALIDHLVDFASTETALETAPVDLSAVAARVLDDDAPALAAARVSVGPLPVVAGDEARLRTVLHNLLHNAAAYACRDGAAEVGVSSRPSDLGHRVEVADRGPGIPEDQRDNVFAPMVRLDRTVKGTGLGLATCERIVRAHGGRIGVDPREGGGAVFWFELPDASAATG